MTTTAIKDELRETLELMEEVLRGGAPLAPEYPLVFGRGFPGRVVSLADEGGPRSACALLVRDFVMPGASLRVGLIGSVSTAEGFRGRGLATRVLQAAEDQLRAEGCVLSMLWADDPAFYVERGYRPVGWECDFLIANELRASLPAPQGVRPAREEDAAAIHALYEAHPVRVARAAEETRALLACPEMSVLVVERAGEAAAYACLGRGRDMRNIVHEWGGATEDVLRLVRAHLEAAFPPPPNMAAERAEAESALFLMAPPAAEELRARLAALGAPSSDGILGLAKLLDREAAAKLMRARVEPSEAVRIEPGRDVDPVDPHVYLVGERCGVELSDDDILYLLMPAHGIRQEIDELAEGFGLSFDLPIQPYCWGLDSI